MERRPTASRTRASAVCRVDQHVLCVLLRDPVSQNVRAFPPGGAIEPGESPAQAAVRETLEETGYEVVVEGEPPPTIVARYPFVWAGTEVDVTTHFVRSVLRDARAIPRPVASDPLIVGTRLVAIAELSRELGYCREILDAVRSLLGA